MIKYTLIVWFQFFLLLSAGAQGTAYSVEIPYENVKGKIIIPAIVDGVEGRYIFDTGAPMCLTYSRAKQENRLLPVTKAWDANGKESEFRNIDLEAVLLGGLKFSKVNAIVFEEGNLLECYGVDGIVGSNLFGSSVIRIDSKRQILVISSDASAYRIPARNSMAMTVNAQNTPYIQISPGMGVREKVMFDSGSGAFVDLTQAVSDKLKELDCLDVIGTGWGALSWSVGGLEKADEKQRVKVADLRIGVGKFRNVTTVTMKGLISRIGSGLLKYGIVTLDYPAGKFSFEPFGADPVDVTKKDWNVTLTLQGDQVVAGCVWNEMSSELKGGEAVMEINGKRIGKFDPCSVMTSEVMKLPGDEATIVVMDSAGQEKKVTIRKE